MSTREEIIRRLVIGILMSLITFAFTFAINETFHRVEIAKLKSKAEADKKIAEYSGACFNDHVRDDLQGLVKDENYIMDDYCKANCHWTKWTPKDGSNLVCTYEPNWTKE